MTASAGIDIVALVASAGSLDALAAVLRDLPVDLDVPVVAQVHLAGQGSVLVSILQRRTGRDVVWAEDGMTLKPGQVVIARPRRALEVFPDGTCALGTTSVSALDHPHDAFLTSVADAYGKSAIAVVLSGMGSDGAVGVRAIRAVGGAVIAQSVDTAEHPAMPLAAAEAGAELVLPLHDIGEVVGRAIGGAPLPLPEQERDAIRTTFGASGIVAGMAVDVDWSATLLGPVHTWPMEWRFAVRMAMDSPHGVAVFLGDDHVQLFNEATLPSLAERHAEFFARPYAESHPDLVDYLLPVLAEVREGGHVHHPATLVPLSRDGRFEDAWFDMSYTPIRDIDGVAVGVIQSFLERTDEVLAARRLSTVDRLATAPPRPNRRAALKHAVAALADSDDIRFALAYSLDARLAHADLVAAEGVDEGSVMAPRQIVVNSSTVWPLRACLDEGVPVEVEDLASRFRGQQLTAVGADARSALVFPIRDEADDRVVAALILGANAALAFDQRYRDFFTLVAETIVAKSGESEARHRERQRAEQLRALDRAKDEFFSDVSHEFRTPLTLMVGPLEQLVADSALPSAARRELDVVLRNARRVLRLVASLLDFSEVEPGRGRPRLMQVDLAALTADTAAMFRAATDAAGLELTVRSDGDLDGVPADPEMWEKIVSNLISNSLKFTWTGRIEVSLERLARHVELVVRDTGIGIPADELPNVTKRFHRVGAQHARTGEGAGIGLALVHSLVRRHHGRMRIASEQGIGTTATVWLPLASEPTDDPAAMPPALGWTATEMADEATRWADEKNDPRDHDAEATGANGPVASPFDATVLIADDNADMRGYLERLLGSVVATLTARDGAEALALARQHRPDVVLADVMMPQIDGFQLLRAIREDDELATTPVILVTARASEDSTVEGLLAGADDYLVKPFSARELVARVTARIETARPRPTVDRRVDGADREAGTAR